MQNEDKQYEGGANSLSLECARQNYIELGASQQAFVSRVRHPFPHEMSIPRFLVGLEKEKQEQIHSRAKTYILATMRAMLSGCINVVDGSDYIAMLANQVDSTWDDKLLLFRGVASECDEFPRASTRQEWDSCALARSDVARAHYADRIRDKVLSACRELEMPLKLSIQARDSPMEPPA